MSAFILPPSDKDLREIFNKCNVHGVYRHVAVKRVGAFWGVGYSTAYRWLQDAGIVGRR